MPNTVSELLLKGAPVCSEYYKNPIGNGFLSLTMAGFVLVILFELDCPRDNLKIIDRRKNLVKPLNGEYCKLERLESVYRSNS
ncbi:ADM_HP2_G0024850.mRNA.1.CDS.1 [Saccharomyces cerevisiae]|nr:ADM_HP2_G0024850.mRNA.1.CDS.1 [Saccharomyces cerevisiae]CAI6450865.1 ADM_HP2_G0024850.mRNA.1.CDS.1 [Saccharomyces cerevisiae]